MGLESNIIDETNFKNVCDWALLNLKKGKLVGLIMKREFID
jgi:hypothetical protein